MSRFYQRRNRTTGRAPIRKPRRYSNTQKMVGGVASAVTLAALSRTPAGRRLLRNMKHIGIEKTIKATAKADKTVNQMVDVMGKEGVRKITTQAGKMVERIFKWGNKKLIRRGQKWIDAGYPEKIHVGVTNRLARAISGSKKYADNLTKDMVARLARNEWFKVNRVAMEAGRRVSTNNLDKYVYQLDELSDLGKQTINRAVKQGRLTSTAMPNQSLHTAPPINSKAAHVSRQNRLSEAIVRHESQMQLGSVTSRRAVASEDLKKVINQVLNNVRRKGSITKKERLILKTGLNDYDTATYTKQAIEMRNLKLKELI